MIFDINYLNIKFQNKTALVSGILIGLSALLASTTVMKSIHNTSMLEKEKKMLMHKRTMMRLVLHITDLMSIYSIFNKNTSYEQFIVALNLLEITQKQLIEDKELFISIKAKDLNALLFVIRFSIVSLSELINKKNENIINNFYLIMITDSKEIFKIINKIVIDNKLRIPITDYMKTSIKYN